MHLDKMAKHDTDGGIIRWICRHLETVHQHSNLASAYSPTASLITPNLVELPTVPQVYHSLIFLAL